MTTARAPQMWVRPDRQPVDRVSLLLGASLAWLLLLLTGLALLFH